MVNEMVNQKRKVLQKGINQKIMKQKRQKEFSVRSHRD